MFLTTLLPLDSLNLESFIKLPLIKQQGFRLQMFCGNTFPFWSVLSATQSCSHISDLKSTKKKKGLYLNYNVLHTLSECLYPFPLGFNFKNPFLQCFLSWSIAFKVKNLRIGKKERQLFIDRVRKYLGTCELYDILQATLDRAPAVLIRSLIPSIWVTEKECICIVELKMCTFSIFWFLNLLDHAV